MASSKILTPAPFPPSECVLPSHQRRGVHTRRAVRGWGVYILEDARHRIGLLQYNLSTSQTIWLYTLQLKRKLLRNNTRYSFQRNLFVNGRSYVVFTLLKSKDLALFTVKVLTLLD
jgi:hypothetical protein